MSEILCFVLILSTCIIAVNTGLPSEVDMVGRFSAWRSFDGIQRPGELFSKLVYRVAAMSNNQYIASKPANKG